MMFSNRDYERIGATEGDDKSWPQVAVMDCSEKDYSVVIMRSKDRPKLLFDTLCTLTDMQYVVHHGTVDTGEEEAYQVMIVGSLRVIHLDAIRAILSFWCHSNLRNTTSDMLTGTP